MDFGNKIVQLRRQEELSQAEFAAKLGTTRGRISQIEINNSKPTLELIIDIINTFKVSADYFFNDNLGLSYNKATNSGLKMQNTVARPTAEYDQNDANSDLKDRLINGLQDQIKTKDKLIASQEDIIQLLKSQIKFTQE